MKLREVRKPLNGGFGQTKGRDRRLSEQLPRFSNLRATHPTGENWLCTLLADLDHAAGDGGRISHRLRGEHHEYAICALVIQCAADCLRVAFRVGISQYVDGVAM